jgi:hypothetical protein
MSEYQGNPKLAGTNIVDCIPQTGECPNRCSECFYNGGRFFRSLDEPWMPNPADVLYRGKIVRVNSGHDSNFQKDLVLAETAKYPRKFYNTAIANFNFPAPVVFTCNGGKDGRLKLVEPVENMMFVRVRTSPWEVDTIERAVDHYLKKHGIPVVLTFMRYYDGGLIPMGHKDAYEWKKHLVNEYFCPKPEMMERVMAHFKGTGIRMCGTIVSSNCVDCRNCEFLYWEAMRRMGAGR